MVQKQSIICIPFPCILAKAALYQITFDRTTPISHTPICKLDWLGLARPGLPCPGLPCHALACPALPWPAPAPQPTRSSVSPSRYVRRGIVFHALSGMSVENCIPCPSRNVRRGIVFHALPGMSIGELYSMLLPECPSGNCIPMIANRSGIHQEGAS